MPLFQKKGVKTPRNHPLVSLSGQSLANQVVMVSEFKHILDWTRHPIGQRLAKGRGSPNLFLLANKKETRKASNRPRPPFRKSQLGGDRGRRRGRFQQARHLD